jgi:integrase
VGRRRKGKPQLRRNEAAKFFATAVAMAEQGDEGAVASLAVLLLGLRSGEIRKRKVRDVDVCDDRVLFWIEDGKTEAATRHLDLPSPVAELLVRQAGDRPSTDWLFASGASDGYRSCTWLIKNVKRICRAAGVPEVCAHGLRGTWATLATDAGVAGHVVARELGHTNPAVTREHYTERGATDRALARKMLTVVDGGKK